MDIRWTFSHPTRNEYTDVFTWGTRPYYLFYEIGHLVSRSPLSLIEKLTPLAHYQSTGPNTWDPELVAHLIAQCRERPTWFVYVWIV